MYVSHDISQSKNLITDPLYSIALSSKSVPMVSVKQTKTQVDFKIMKVSDLASISLNDTLKNLKQLLGNPYHSRCLASGHKLKYFDMYTEKHCYHECSVESIAQECQCRFVRRTRPARCPRIVSTFKNLIILRAPFFPKKMTYRICSFYEQAECIAPKVIGFDYDRCKKCLPECNSTRHIADAFQNGIYRTTDGNQDKSAIKTATMVLYMTEVDEVVYTGESYHMTHIIFTCD